MQSRSRLLSLFGLPWRGSASSSCPSKDVSEPNRERQRRQRPICHLCLWVPVPGLPNKLPFRIEKEIEMTARGPGVPSCPALKHVDVAFPRNRLRNPEEREKRKKKKGAPCPSLVAGLTAPMSALLWCISSAARHQGSRVHLKSNRGAKPRNPLPCFRPNALGSGHAYGLEGIVV